MRHLAHLFTQAAAQQPQQVALISADGRQMSYARLEQLSQQLATTLKEHGIRANDRIGLLLPKSFQSLAALFATLLVDAAYVPVDAQAPLSRAAYILANCQARAIWVDQSLADAFCEGYQSIEKTIAFPDGQMSLLICQYPDASPLELPSDLAYILYTSGSTGTPKGVMITHANALSFVDWCASQFQPNTRDVFSSIAPLHFDLSIFDLFVAIKHGASLLLINQKEAKNPMLVSSLLAEHEVSICYATPTLFKVLLSYGKLSRYDHSKLRLVLFAGEVFPIAPLRALTEHWPAARFYNLYGPTETNVVTWFQVPDTIEPDQLEPFPIGKACSNAVCKIWDGRIIEPAPGGQGELIVGGEAVAFGYINMPQKNETAFFYQEDGSRWYHTGDLVWVNDRGDFVFKGRKDRMVKRRGYRIELGEVEAVLAHHPLVREAGVVARHDENGEIGIEAYYSLEPLTEAPNTLQLKEHCLQYIPLYMLPDRFFQMEQLPQTSTHKVDYQSLKTSTND